MTWWPQTEEFLSVVGPTGSGKTALAVQVAKGWLMRGQQVSVISLDSRQVWRECPLLSVADVAVWQTLQQQFPGRLQVYNLASHFLSEDYCFGTLLADAREQLTAGLAAGRWVLTVGGTLVCHQRLLAGDDDWIQIPPDDNVRFAAENMSVGDLQNWLARVDGAALEAMNESDRANPRRLVRRIEIAINHKVYGRQPTTSLPHYRQYWLATTFKREQLLSRVTERVKRRFTDQAVREEVAKVLAMYPDILSDKVLRGKLPLGLVQLAGVVTQKLDEQEALSSWQVQERRYAKRQISFLRRLLVSHDTDLIDQREVLAN